MRRVDMPVDYHVVWDAVLERTLSKTHAKGYQHHAQLKDRFVDSAE